MKDRLKPYNDLPLLPPPVDIETKAILKRCVVARAALAELKLAGHLIPDQSVLISAIPILEARGSSEIENIVTTNDALFREASLADHEGDPQTKEALRYRTALYSGHQAIKERPLSTRTAIDICRTLTDIDLDIRATPGTQLKNHYTGEIIYTPPEGRDHIRELLGNWERFLNEETDIDPVIRMAVLHYQFEAIHPFPDGNGRTGRILNILTLVQNGLLDQPTLYLSRHILRSRSDYYRLLARVTSEAEWEPWILYMLEAVELTARWTNDKVRAVRALMEETATAIRSSAPTVYSRELIELIFSQPYCRIANVVERGIAKRHTASTYLQTLVTIGILDEEKQWRDKIFVHRKYLNLLSSDQHTFEPYQRAKVAANAASKARRRSKG